MCHDLRPRSFHQAYKINRGCSQLFTKPLAFKSLPASSLSFQSPAQPKNQWRGATTGVAPPTRQKGATLVRVGGNDRHFLFITCLRFPFVSDDPVCFRLVQWNPSPAPANQPLLDDSSESDRYSPVPYGGLDALRFKAELEVA
jgi:hypothetical protein